MARVAFTLSVALNLALATGLVVARVDESRNQVTAARALAEAPSTEPLDAIGPAATVRELVADLRGAGVDDEITRYVVAGWLQRQRQLRGEIRAYWKPPDDVAFTAAIDAIADDRARRTELIRAFGASVATDPLFAELFLPLGTEYAFLNAEQQAAVQLWRIELGRRRSGSDDRQRCVAAAGQPSGAVVVDGSARSELHAVLDDAAVFELELRTSPLALELRDQSMTETVFRQAFRAVQRLTSARDAGQHMRARADLRRLLGDSRFERFWSRHDPAYCTLHRVLSDHGLGDALIAAAYGVTTRAQEGLLRLHASTSSDPLAARSIVGREQRELENLIGEEATRAYLATRNRFRTFMEEEKEHGKD